MNEAFRDSECDKSVKCLGSNEYLSVIINLQRVAADAPHISVVMLKGGHLSQWLTLVVNHAINLRPLLFFLVIAVQAALRNWV